MEHCWPWSRTELGVDAIVRGQITDVDSAIDALAEFLWLHRDSAQREETSAPLTPALFWPQGGQNRGGKTPVELFVAGTAEWTGSDVALVEAVDEAGEHLGDDL
jgi:hypothetical protein